MLHGSPIHRSWMQASQSSPMQLNPSAMLNMAAAPVPTSMASPPGSLPHSSALFHQQASNLSAALQQFQAQPHLMGRPLEDGVPGAPPGSLPATPQQGQDLLPFFPHSASVAALMDMSPSELRPTETLPASRQPRQLVIHEFQPGKAHPHDLQRSKQTIKQPFVFRNTLDCVSSYEANQFGLDICLLRFVL